MRELTQAELQIFFNPETFKPDFDKVKNTEFNVVPFKTKEQVRISAEKLVADFGVPEFYAYHMAVICLFYRNVIGIPDEKFRFLEKGGDEKAFYNKLHMDLEANVESWGGFKEIGGLHYRGDYDLTCHSKGSGKDLSVKIDGKDIMPNVLELSFGVDRNIWTLIDLFYQDDKERQVLKLKPWLSPFTAAIFPLQKDESVTKAAADIRTSLSKQFKIFFDDAGSIGRRYARMDEIGTPFCITVDFESVDSKSKDFGTVTVRERDGKVQERVKIADLATYVANKTSYIFEH
jgi:glycyl-tRNA synthetase